VPNNQPPLTDATCPRDADPLDAVLPPTRREGLDPRAVRWLRALVECGDAAWSGDGGKTWTVQRRPAQAAAKEVRR
jgi:hypothetical protein